MTLDAPPTERSKYWLCFSIAALVVFVDQSSKFIAVTQLTHAIDHHGAAGFLDQLRIFYGSHNLDGRPAHPATPDLRRNPVVLVPNFWNFVYAENTGGAFSVFANWREHWRLPLFNVVTLLAIMFIVSAIRRSRPDQGHTVAALGLVLGGALGNYVCRVTRRYVIDFIDWHWFDHPRLHWPTFNLADASICVGVALLLGFGIAEAWKSLSPSPRPVGLA